MVWLKKVAVQQAAKDGEMAALICSLVHHKQGATCPTRGELLLAMDKGTFGIDTNFCACCGLFGGPSSCCLNKSSGCPLMDGHCCEGLWSELNVAYNEFRDTPTPANFAAFQETEEKVCDYIQAVIDKKKEPEETYSIGDRFEDKKKVRHILIAVNNQTVIMGLLSSGLHHGPAIKVKKCYSITQEEFDSAYPNFTRYFDGRKQQKVGEKSEQGKSEVKKSEAEPELSGGDIFTSHATGSIYVYDTHHDFALSAKTDCGQMDAKKQFQNKGITIHGNLQEVFDDLTETNEGFEMEQDDRPTIKVELGSGIGKAGECIHINQGADDVVLIDYDTLDEFHRNLGHVLNGIRSKT